MGVTCVLHAILILLCRYWHRTPPPLLEFPRLELFLFMFITQPVGQLAGREAFPDFYGATLWDVLPATQHQIKAASDRSLPNVTQACLARLSWHCSGCLFPLACLPSFRHALCQKSGCSPSVVCAAAEMIASGSGAARAGGIAIFVVGCAGFVLLCMYIVYRSVHRHDTRKARWVLPAVEDDQVCFNCVLDFLFARLLLHTLLLHSMALHHA